MMTELDSLGIPVNVSLADFLLADAEKHGDKKAYIDAPTGRAFTYKELKSGCQKIAAALWKRGWRTGDVVCMFAETCVQFPFMFLSAAKLGLVVHPVNPVFTKDEILRHMELVSAKYIVLSIGTLERAKSAMENYKNVEDIVVLDNIAGYTSIDDMLAEEEAPFPEVTFDPKTQVVLMPTTSGTTGLPKATLHTHYTLIAATCEMNGMNKRKGEEVILTTVPYFGMYSSVYALLMGVEQGFTIIVLPVFSLEAFLSAVQKYKVSLCYSTPAVVVQLTKSNLLDKYDLSSLTDLISAGAPLSSDTARTAMERLPHTTFRQIYGLTELPPLTNPAPTPYFQSGTVGKPMKHSEIKVVDIESKRELRAHERGELLARGPHLFQGYFNNPESSQTSVTVDGWLNTGDVGYVDDDGYIYVTDRVKELIKVSSFQVSPAELEAVLVTHKAVSDAAVIGIAAEEEVGQKPKAFIVLQPGENVSEAEICAFMQELVSPTKQLTGGIQFVDAIPRTATGKIQRRKLHELHQRNNNISLTKTVC